MKAIRLDRILYLEKEKKKKYTVIHCSGGEDYNEKLPLEKAYEKLPKDIFLYINRGHIINMEHITCLEKEEITLADSVRLPVSRYRMTAVKDELDTVFQGFYDSNHFLDIMDGSLAISMQICRCILSGIYIMDDGSFGGSFNNHSIELYCITLKFTVLHWLNAYGWRYAVGLLGNYNC